MAGRPPKLSLVIKGEKKSHRTKAELAVREQGEKSLLTGSRMREWPEVAADQEAHKHFVRIRSLLKKISHDDAIHEPVINRYCLLISECKTAERGVNESRDEITELRRMYESREIEPMAYIQEKGAVQDRILAWDKRLMDKRKMLLQIERENVMTILGALRAIPKKVEKKTESSMAKFLQRKQGEGSA